MHTKMDPDKPSIKLEEPDPSEKVKGMYALSPEPKPPVKPEPAGPSKKAQGRHTLNHLSGNS